MKQPQLKLLLILLLTGFQSNAQEELTPQEKAYRDSITALNIQNLKNAGMLR